LPQSVEAETPAFTSRQNTLAFDVLAAFHTVKQPKSQQSNLTKYLSTLNIHKMNREMLHVKCQPAITN